MTTQKIGSHLDEVVGSTPVEEREDQLVFSEHPIFDELRAELCDPYAEHYLYLDSADVERDAFDREEPEPWYPHDLRSVAQLLAARVGTTYTGFTRQHADELAKQLAPQPASVTEWLVLNRPNALTAPTLLGLDEDTRKL